MHSRVLPRWVRLFALAAAASTALALVCAGDPRTPPRTSVAKPIVAGAPAPAFSLVADMPAAGLGRLFEVGYAVTDLNTAMARFTQALGIQAWPASASWRGEPLRVEDAKRIWRSSVLNGPNGVYIGPDGNVYAASLFGSEITVQDPRTGMVIDRIGPERGVHGPDDLVLAPDGTIYWTEPLAGNVGMLEPDGSFRVQAVGAGVNPITLSDDGRLFVARSFFGEGLYELDPELLAPARPVVPDLAELNGMDFGPDGLLYAPRFFAGDIVRLDVNAADPQPEVVATGLRIAAAVKFNSAGELHAVDFAEGRVIKVDVASGNLQVLADIEGTLDNLAFDARDRLYASAFPDGQILTMKPGRRLTALNPTGFTDPAGVAVAPDRTVWVADTVVMRGFRSRRNPQTSIYFRFDPPLQGPAIANTVFDDGDLLITSSPFTNSVQVFDPASGVVHEDIRTLATPSNAIRHGAALVATQIGAGNVVDANSGQVLIGGLQVPLGLASDGHTLYVSDWASGTVWAAGETGPALPLASGLSSPEGLAVDGDRLLVVEQGRDRVSAIHLASGAVSTVIDGLDLGAPVVPGAPVYGIFNGVAVAADRSIFVTADGANAVYEFKRHSRH